MSWGAPGQHEATSSARAEGQQGLALPQPSGGGTNAQDPSTLSGNLPSHQRPPVSPGVSVGVPSPSWRWEGRAPGSCSGPKGAKVPETGLRPQDTPVPAPPPAPRCLLPTLCSPPPRPAAPSCGLGLPRARSCSPAWGPCPRTHRNCQPLPAPLTCPRPALSSLQPLFPSTSESCHPVTSSLALSPAHCRSAAGLTDMLRPPSKLPVSGLQAPGLRKPPQLWEWDGWSPTGWALHRTSTLHTH